MAVVLISAFPAPGQTPKRTRLSGQIPAVVPSLKPLGRLDASTRLNLSIDLALHDRDALTNLLEQLYDPASPLYRHYLTPDEFDQRFGPTEADYQTVIAWATRSGFTIKAGQSNRLILKVSASVAEIERAFQVTMQTYAHPTEARTFFAPDSEPALDAAGIPISNIDGLDNFARPRPMNLHRAPLKRASKAKPDNIGSGPNGNLAGFDYRAAYAPGVTLTGTGQSVGLLEFDSYYPQDIATYESITTVPAVPLDPVPLDGGGTPGSADGEVALDIEMAISMAPGLAKVVVFEGGATATGNSMLATMTTSTYTNVKQFSCSWSFGPITTAARNTMETYFMKFAADGQSFFTAVGDDGSTTNGTAFMAPDDDPYITVVGGTVLATAGASSHLVIGDGLECARRPGLQRNRRRHQHPLRHPFLAKGCQHDC